MVRKLNVFLMALMMTAGSVALAGPECGDAHAKDGKEKAAQCAEGKEKSSDCCPEGKVKGAGCAEGKQAAAAGCAEGKDGAAAGCAEGKQAADADCCPGTLKATQVDLDTHAPLKKKAKELMMEAHGAYKVGSKVDSFQLKSAASGEVVDLKDVAGEKATVLIFWNQDCPYVVEAQDRISDFHKQYAEKGVHVVAVDSGVNIASEDLAAHAKTRPFPILENKDSLIAAKFAATRTPEVFILDSDMVVQYHGAFDSGKFNEEGERKAYVHDAITELLAGKQPTVKETRAFGCSLKYARGVKPNEV